VLGELTTDIDRFVQRVAVTAEMQLDLVSLMNHAFDLLESGLARFAARPSPGRSTRNHA
jgi:hypothetical protein